MPYDEQDPFIFDDDPNAWASQYQSNYPAYASGKANTSCRVMLSYLRLTRADPTQPTIRELKAVSCPITGIIIP
jgi:hypothetical protein